MASLLLPPTERSSNRLAKLAELELVPDPRKTEIWWVAGALLRQYLLVV